MKQKTIDNYSKRIENVVKYIHENLDGDLSLEHLSEIACFAPYHFHRIFQSVQGQTLKKYVRYIKLQRAEQDLLKSEMSVGRISKRAGYDNVDSFIRRFSQDFGMSPNKYRKMGSEGKL